MRTRSNLLIVALLSVAMLFVGMPSASAESRGPLKSSCSGSKLATKVIRNTDGRRIGRSELWYSSINGGQNCVITYNEVPGRANTYAYLIIDDNRNRRHDSTDRVSYDIGDYQYYAGASYRNRTNGKCVKWGGWIRSYQGFGDVGSNRWVHCG